MNNNSVSFDNYQAKYESAIPLSLRKGYGHMQKNVRKTVQRIDRVIQKPEFILKIVQLALAFFSVFPSFDSFLKNPKLLCKDAKNVSNFLKGIKSIDGLLNFKCSIKPIILNVSGLTLFFVSSLSLIDRFKLFNIQGIKTQLSALPIFGILPFGGLLSFALIGLMGVVSLLSKNKLKGFEKTKLHIANEKIIQWKTPLQLSDIQNREKEYQSTIDLLKMEMADIKGALDVGEQKKGLFAAKPSQLYACQKALDEIGKIQKKKEIEIKSYEKKLAEWSDLEIDFARVPNNLKIYQEKKLAKWEKKLGVIETKKTMTRLGIANNLIILLRQVASLGSVAAGFGIFNPSRLVNAGLDATIAGMGIAVYLLGKRIN